jgi:hypothetical protein
MCTTIASGAAVTGSGKGANGWFHVDQVYLGYDHPFHAQLEHAVSIDFVNEVTSTKNRLTVELSRESARELANRLLAIVDEADAFESS